MYTSSVRDISEYVIGVDLGGTAIKVGQFDRRGHCLQSLSVPTPQPPQAERVSDAIVEAISLVDPSGAALAIGIGTPGPTDADGRIARVAINLGWKDIPLADWLEAKTGKPTVLANDANCAGLGEYWLGAGQPFRDLILLTLGTGVGGAVILDGKLWIGRTGTAGELGLITLDWTGPECNSGNRGSLEQHVSVTAIRRRTGLEPAEWGRRSQAGDPDAIAFWSAYGCELGAGLASLVYVFTPEAILLGGGVSASAEFFIPAVQAELERRVLPTSREGLQILPAQLGNQAGMVGAAKLAWDHLAISNSRLSNPSPPITPATAPPSPSDLAYQMATELSRFKGGFLARTSHELRSPLNAIVSLHQLILSDLCDSPAEEREFVAQANAAAQKMLHLLDELIHISKLEHGTAHLQIQPLSLVEILREVQRLAQMQAKNRSIRLEVILPEPDLYILADPRWILQILLKLVDTPISLMHEGTVRVTVHPNPEQEQVNIWIEDDRLESHWEDPMHFLQSSPVSNTPLASQTQKAIASQAALSVTGKPSDGMSLLVLQTLLELMQGRLELLSIPTPSSPQTCIQCSIPLVLAEDDS